MASGAFKSPPASVLIKHPLQNDTAASQSSYGKDVRNGGEGKFDFLFK
jgi:hypothetical protein